MKTKNIFHMASLAGLLAVLACTSCSKHKEPENQAQAAAKRQTQESFSATRTGAIVDLEWTYDLSVYKSAELYKNATGQSNDRDRVSVLKSGEKHYKDTLIEPRAYYYWLKVTLPDGSDENIGPIRVKPDEKGIGNYPHITRQYPWSVFRNYKTATISWAFPEARYDYIKVIRSPSPDPLGYRNRGVEVYSTMEWKESIVDTFPDPDSDYWYRIEIKISDGPVIRQGPIAPDVNP
ncbi:hypothetical protein OH491_08335 [Termitidicoccus mucosus]|uniref:hypothetical protein n=1 Tax=Termitidicoccus mucosus TaxID=1184151 RepID=UPI0031838031